MTQNRKRSRSFHDETDFMPLSKRINNLHINNMLAEQHSAQLAQWDNTQLTAPNATLPESPSESEQSVDWNNASSPQYRPDLDESQNPHYFNINKLLYEMYMQRVSRGCHQI